MRSVPLYSIWHNLEISSSDDDVVATFVRTGCPFEANKVANDAACMSANLLIADITVRIAKRRNL